MPEDLYRTLNVESRATPEEIQRAYRTLARRYHPDLNPLPAAATLMAAINAAYEVLGEPVRRAAYDRRSQKKKESPVDHMVLIAAREHILRQGWAVVDKKTNDFIFKIGAIQVQVALVLNIDQAALRRHAMRASTFLVILAVHVDPEIRIPSTGIVVIDLMHSRLVGGRFPDQSYQDLFKKLF